MLTDSAFDTLKNHGGKACTAQFWMSDTPSQQFASLRESLLYLPASSACAHCGGDRRGLYRLNIEGRAKRAKDLTPKSRATSPVRNGIPKSRSPSLCEVV